MSTVSSVKACDPSQLLNCHTAMSACYSRVEEFQTGNEALGLLGRILTDRPKLNSNTNVPVRDRDSEKACAGFNNVITGD